MNGIERYLVKIPRKDISASARSAPSRPGCAAVDPGHTGPRDPTQGPSTQSEVEDPLSKGETSDTPQAKNVTTPPKKRPASPASSTLIANEPAFLNFAIGKERIKKTRKVVVTKAAQTSLSLLNKHTTSPLYMPD